MPVLAEVYIQELATGNIPAPGSPEALAYQAWSKAYEKGRRENIAAQIVKESALKIYGSAYYLLGSL